MPCKYWDEGWCYAPEDVEATEMDGQCINMDRCPQAIPMSRFIFDTRNSLEFIDSGDDTEEHW